MSVYICRLREHAEGINFKLDQIQRSRGFTFNESKCISRTTKIKLLGYEVSKITMIPNPERFPSLLRVCFFSSLKPAVKAQCTF